MATAAILVPPAVTPQPRYEPIISSTFVKRKLQHALFDPEQHLAYEPPRNIVMMKEIGYSEDTGVSPVAVSQPFRLFSTECVQKFRDEVLSDEVMKNCFYKSTLAACQLRGYAAKLVHHLLDWLCQHQLTRVEDTHPSHTTHGRTLPPSPSSPKSPASNSSLA